MWQVIEATNIHSGQKSTVEMNVFPKGEVMKYALIWFPSSLFKDHTIKPVEKENPKNDRASRKRNL